MELEGARVLVTGAARGLGYCFAAELVREGAAVAAVDVNGAALRELERECAGMPGTLACIAGDVADEASVRGFVREAGERVGPVNVLVNNAGVLLDGLLVQEDGGWVKRLPEAQWKRVLDVNLTGPFLVAREVAAAMLERGEGGVIVNLSSVSRVGNEGQSVYAASKAGLDAATRTWALELAAHGIRVAGIAPGVIDTPILENVSEAAKAHLLSRIPLGRYGTPHEVWLALRFILECDFFTGRVLEVDGGASA
jgi:3-oxoacyl-[acyl-carrier protein] reductase